MNLCGAFFILVDLFEVVSSLWVSGTCVAIEGGSVGVVVGACMLGLSSSVTSASGSLCVWTVLSHCVTVHKTNGDGSVVVIGEVRIYGGRAAGRMWMRLRRIVAVGVFIVNERWLWSVT